MMEGFVSSLGILAAILVSAGMLDASLTRIGMASDRSATKLSNIVDEIRKTEYRTVVMSRRLAQLQREIHATQRAAQTRKAGQRSRPVKGTKKARKGNQS